MKRIKILSASDPALIGKEADITIPHKNVVYINGQRVQLTDLKVNIIKDSSVIDVTLIAYNELPDTFPIKSLTERVLYYCYDHKIQTGASNIERRFRQLRDERGKINYKHDDKIHAYRKLPLLERTFQETIKFDKSCAE
jgi:hypothetical protein